MADLDKLRVMSKMVAAPIGMPQSPINISIDLGDLVAMLARMTTRDDELRTADRIQPAPG